MKIVQLINSDGQYAGLYVYEHDRDPQPIFDECARRAEMAEEQWADDDLLEDERDDAETVFENYLSEEGFTRVFVTEVYTNFLI